MLQLARWQVYGILTVVIGAILLTLPNLVPKADLAHWPGVLPKQQINLGLDLRGGSHVVFQVDKAALVAERLDNLQEEIRAKLREPRIGYADLRRQDDQIRLKLVDPTQMDEARRILGTLTGGSNLTALGGKAAAYAVSVENGELAVTFTKEAQAEATADAVTRSIEIFRKRLDEFGTTEPLLQAQGADRIIVQLPGIADPERIIDLLGKTAKMTFHLVDDANLPDAERGRIPPGEQLLPLAEPGRGPESVLIKKRVSVSGESLIDAQGQLDAQRGDWVVSFKFDSEGTRKFGDVTRENIGKRFAVVLDGKVITAPRINGQILQGQGEIYGGFTQESATGLAVLLRAGALPAKFTVIEKRTVGAELGADSIKAGIAATVIAGVAVIIFMIVAYGLFGVFSDIAVIINVIIILAILSLLRSTLTLPGIAGIVLTVGMAVDSNVLIYERMKEELKAGKTAINALDAGFSRALPTILDANFTTAIAAAILFQLGAGPVRGFAVTHLIGTLTTIFTAFTMTRLMIAVWARRVRPKHIPIDPRPGPDGKRPWFRLIPEGFNFPFMKYRHIADAISLAGVLGSLALFATVGLNYSIDFKGGVLIELSTAGPADLGKIRQISDGLGLGHAQVQEFGAPNDVLIRLESQKGGDAAQQAALAKVQDALKSGLAEGAKIVRTEVVGPTVGGELVWDGIKALAIAVVLMMIYVWFRFEWQFGVGAVAGLFHDIALTIGVFALFHLEFSLTSIAALLTTVGYSMNDKVVISDRIRENLRKYKKLDLTQLIDQSLNETLSRTAMTAVTTLLALGSLYIFGGEVIRVFTLAMILGVIVGTYSSLYIAAPLLVLTGVKRDWSGLEKKPVRSGARTAP
jgi:SecD/SecF fusion protein